MQPSEHVADVQVVESVAALEEGQYAHATYLEGRQASRPESHEPNIQRKVACRGYANFPQACHTNDLKVYCP